MHLDIFNYKDIPLYVVELPYGLSQIHREYFTRIPWGEYKRIRYAERFNSLSNYDLKLKIFRDYTVRNIKWTEYEIELLPAGIVDTISNLIMYVSDSGIIPDSEGNINIRGFTNRLNLYRAIATTNVEFQMYTVICLVFKAYTFEMLDKLPFDRIASLFASAEKYLLENNILKHPLQIFDPKELEAKEKQKPPVFKKTGGEMNPEENDILMKMLKMKQDELAASKQDPNASGYQGGKKLDPITIKKTDGYIPPKDKVVVSNGIKVNVPGIKIEKEAKYGGFDKEDFEGLPVYTDEEALAMQLEMGLAPAGYDIIIAREEAARLQKEKEESLKPKTLKKNKFKRK